MKDLIKKIEVNINHKDFNFFSKLQKEDLTFLLEYNDKILWQKIFDFAYLTKKHFVNNISYYRGLIEFSNLCIKNCNYCGIRKDNKSVERFSMEEEEILSLAKWAYDNEYGSITLQSGERIDDTFIDFVEDILFNIKKSYPKLGITLCLGEQSFETYERWKKMGADRYLLRIETSNEKLYKKLHPQDGNHDFQKRIECLKSLKKLDYQVGTGVMIGLPYQKACDLADDLIFFRDFDIDMLGMGPYIFHADTPLGTYVNKNNLNDETTKKMRFNLSLKMIAIARLFLKDVNIAATTALQSLDPLGREKGLKCGANILMPIITSTEHRGKYQLYENKPCIDDDKSDCKNCLTRRVLSIGDSVGWGENGNSRHFYNRLNAKNQ